VGARARRCSALALALWVACARDARIGLADARCELAAVFGDFDQLVALRDEWVADELGVQRVFGRGRGGEEDQEHLPAQAAYVARDLQWLGYGRTNADHRDLRWVVNPVGLVDDEPHLARRLRDAREKRRARRFDQQQSLSALVRRRGGCMCGGRWQQSTRSHGAATAEFGKINASASAASRVWLLAFTGDGEIGDEQHVTGADIGHGESADRGDGV